MSSETLRPNGDAYKSGLTYSGGSTAHSLLSDNSDASYVIIDTQDVCIVDFGACTFPAGAVVLSVTPRIRIGYSALGTNSYIRVRTGKGSTSTYDLTTLGSDEYFQTTNSAATYTLAAQPYSYGTTAKWTEDDLNAIQMRVTQHGSGTTQRWYEGYLDVKYAEAPTVGSVAIDSDTVSTPTVTWIYTAGSDGGPQARYEIKIFDSTTYGGGGFSADTSTATYSETGYGAIASKQLVGAPLVAGTTYKVYVRCSANTNGEYQPAVAWAASSGFTYSPDPPGVPTLTVTPDSVNFRAALVLQGHDNLTGEQSSSLETAADVGQWVPTLGSCTLAQSTDKAVSPGTGSLKMESTAGSTMAANTGTGTNGRPVVAGRAYRAIGSAIANATTRNCVTNMVWYDGSGSQIGTTSGTPVAVTSGAFVEMTTDGTAPANAQFAALTIAVQNPAGAGEIFYWDHLGIFETAGAAPSTWTRGGLIVSPVTAELFCKIQYQDAGTTTWTNVRGASALQPGANQLYDTVYDTGLRPGVERTYRAIEYYVQSGNTTEGAAAAGSQTVDLDLTHWLLRCPADPTLDMVIRVRSEGQMVRRNPQGVFDVLGAVNPIVVTDVRHEIESTLSLRTATAAERTALLALLNAGEVLLLTGPSAQGAETRYIVPGDVSEVRPLEPFATAEERWWEIPYTQVEEPA